MQHITCKFGNTEVKNITDFSWSVSRPVAPNGRVGSKAHDIGEIRISRRKSLHDGGTPKLEGEIIGLAAATEKKAYFDGEVTMARADDSANKVQQIRWKDGHICGLSTTIMEQEIVEQIVIAVPELDVDDWKFMRAATN